MKQMQHAGWLAAAILVATTWTMSACGEDPAASSSSGSVSGDPAGGSSGTVSGDPSGGSSGTVSGDPSGGSSGTVSGSSSGGDANVPDATADGGESSEDPNATPANFKVVFIGDTGTGKGFKDVLALIKREKAQAVLVQGDVEYGGDKASDWLPVIDGELQTGTITIPYFVSRGNHDQDWTSSNGLGPALETRLASWNITPDHNKPTQGNYALTYKGLKIVMVDQSNTTPSRADYVKSRLAEDRHYWKICSWHKNQRDTNVGPKGDEMGWQIYENCRNAGAIVAQGHSHTYSRSETVTADSALTVDATCSDPFALCVGPGKHFFFDSSLGGVDRRTLEETDKPHWASTYASDFGALFIEFNVDGDPKKAKGYFKTVGNQIIDPPAKSGKTFFTITSSN